MKNVSKRLQVGEGGGLLVVVFYGARSNRKEIQMTPLRSSPCAQSCPIINFSSLASLSAILATIKLATWQ